MLLRMPQPNVLIVRIIPIVRIVSRLSEKQSADIDGKHSPLFRSALLTQTNVSFIIQ